MTNIRPLGLPRQSPKKQTRGSALGQSLTEFALVLPILMLVIGGIIQFGIVYSQYQVLQGAAREGARCAAVQAAGFSTCDVETAVRTAAITYDLTNTPTANIVCTGDNVGSNVTVSWLQTFDLGAIPRLVPGIPDTVDARISGTFRCE